MIKSLKSTIFLAIIFGFVSCQKKSQVEPVSLTSAIESENSPEPTDNRKKYKKWVTVQDELGIYYVDYLLSSNNKELLEHTFNEFRNSNLKIEDKEDYFLRIKDVINPVKNQKSFVKDINPLIIKNEDVQRTIFIEMLENNVPAEKVYECKRNGVNNKINYFLNKWTFYTLVGSRKYVHLINYGNYNTWINYRFNDDSTENLSGMSGKLFVNERATNWELVLLTLDLTEVSLVTWN